MNQITSPSRGKEKRGGVDYRKQEVKKTYFCSVHEERQKIHLEGQTSVKRPNTGKEREHERKDLRKKKKKKNIQAPRKKAQTA